MNKKVMIGIIAVMVIAIVGFGAYFLFNDKDKTNESATSSSNNSVVDENTGVNNATNKDDTTTTSNGKTFVVYYSASGSTKKVAEQIATNLNADLFEIVPEDIYTSEDLNWTNENSRVSREHNDESLRHVKLKNTTVDNWESYDTVLIGYPIWWGIAAWPVDTFVESNDFTGKTVIPFCTSSSSGLGQSGDLLANKENTGNWKEGYRFSSGASDSDISKWTNSIK